MKIEVRYLIEIFNSTNNLFSLDSLCLYIKNQYKLKNWYKRYKREKLYINNLYE